MFFQGQYIIREKSLPLGRVRHNRMPGTFTMRNYLVNIDRLEIAKNIVKDLSAPQKSISSTFFYDAMGSKLFQQITQLPEYYPTRTEIKLLHRFADRLAAPGKPLNIIEIGSGDCSKISILLSAIPPEHWSEINYTPIDVSAEAIRESAEDLRQRFPGIKITALLADFTTQLHLVPNGTHRLFCFLGSTIGNLSRQQNTQFFLDLGRIMRSGDALLLGVDLVKPVEILEKAYNDRSGVTAAFNRNILLVVNRLIGTEFDPQAFNHLAFYNPEQRRMEMHLEATSTMRVRVPAFSREIFIAKSETIHTESSHKYLPPDIEGFASTAGLTISTIETDENRWYSLIHFVKK